MKFKPRSFRKSKSKPSEAEVPVGTSETDAGQPSTVKQTIDTEGAAADAAAGGSAVITPPVSPQEAPPEARQDVNAVVPPSPRDIVGAPRPLRLGSFNFDKPDANFCSHTGQSTPQSLPLAFPPLFHEADDMLNLSNLIYTMAELRDLARNGVLNDPAASSRILDVPLPLDTALKIIGAEGELLREVLDDGKHEATLSALEALLERQKEKVVAKEDEAKAKEHKKTDSGMFGWMSSWDGCLAGGFSFDELNFCGDLSHIIGEDGAAGKQSTQQDSSMITAVGDLKNEEELVYAVAINPAEERITVVFRGSVTKTDFKTDAKISMAQAPDPRKFNNTESEQDHAGGNVGVHQGFYEYLLGEPGGKMSKYAEIMKHVSELYKDNSSRRSYKLYVTGHSLGGALATLFGFYAAASPVLPLPVTVVSVASPRVGNVAFARTFAEFESQGKLRHLRIANHKDPVTFGPTVSSKRALALSAKPFSPLGDQVLKLTDKGAGVNEEMYYHTGMKMKLFRDVSAVGSQRCEMSYSGATIVAGAKKPVAIDRDDMADIEQSNKRKKKESNAELPMVSYHFGTRYSERMAGAESDLRGMTLNGLYKEKVGGMPWVS